MASDAPDVPEAHDACHVVSLTIEEGIAVLTARAHGRWLYTEAEPSQLKDKERRSRLMGLIARLHGDDKKRSSDHAATADSGYASPGAGGEVGNDEDKTSESGSADAEEELRGWLLASLEDTCAELAHGCDPRDAREMTLAQWYGADVLCYGMTASEDAAGLLQPVARHDLDPGQIRDNLTPSMSMPKKLRRLQGVPWLEPADVVVLEEADDIHMSIHPTLVRTRDASGGTATHFLKLAERGFEAAVKREIDILHRLERDGLHSRGIRAPRLTGIVAVPGSPKSRTHILGFLLSVIPQPSRPLIELMDASVSATKRNTWAAEVEGMVRTLHENGIVWGDAKADNFLLDAEERLWIIDFGGAYTVGWVDEELEETVEGDDMGTEKIVNGLRDPDECTLMSDEEKSVEAKAGERRKRSAADRGDADGSANKRRKSD